ncbi:MAG: sulfatase-like hydrolase/transferase [Verrucomicrobia bacterium]|nr:sulfatase-like hydrolase/transferase [Verrucomicrobiota bacterium]
MPAADQPNILWITSEDHGPHMGCYGDQLARTPNVDALAAKGMLFKRAWSCAPVCAPARTTLISGMFPPSLGAEHMRSEVPMPRGAKMYPQLLREAGYYCSNNAKEDYNLTKPGQVWDESSRTGHWKNRPAGKPFFAVFNSELSHESKIRVRPHTQVLDPAKVRVPAYHPDTPEVRQDWAQYYDIVSEVDAVAGQRLKELADAGLADDTIVFYYADHGSGMPRNKRWPCNSGLQMPLVVYFPAKWRHLAPTEYQPGGKSDRLVSFVDFAPTLCSLAGVKPPAEMQGHAFAGKFQEAPQPFIYGFRGRMDERRDVVRSVTDGRYVYLRNYMPHLSQGQHVGYQFQTPTTAVWRKLFDEGKLNEAQSIFWKTPKAPEELYDLQTDPDEVRNLAGSPEHQAVLKKLRQAQQELAVKIRDTGFLSEAEVHSRSGDAAPRDALASDKTYPFQRVFAAADLATLLKPEALPELKKLLKDADSGVRYWGAMGILMRGQGAVVSSKAELATALNDSSPSVRIAAAEALGKHGTEADLKAALAALKNDADPTKTSAYAATAAMNVIDMLGKKAAPLVDFIKTMPTKDPKAVARANEYVSRLQATVLDNFNEKPAAEPAAKGRKAKGKKK